MLFPIETQDCPKWQSWGKSDLVKNIEEEELVSFVIVRNTGYALFEVASTENLESRLRSENIAVLLNFPFIAMFAQFQFPSALPPWSYSVAQLDVI